MKFEITDNSLNKISADAVIAFTFSSKTTSVFNDLDKIFSGSLVEQVKSENFKAKVGEIMAFYTDKKILSPKIYIVGLGPMESFTANDLRRSVAIFAKIIKGKASSLAVSVLSPSETNLNIAIQADVITEGILLGDYSFNKYKKLDTKEKELEIDGISVIGIYPEDYNGGDVLVKDKIAVLFEIGNIQNKKSVEILTNPSNIQIVSDSMIRGLKNVK